MIGLKQMEDTKSLVNAGYVSHKSIFFQHH